MSESAQGTEPDKGGMTAFAQAGIQVPVKAGSAVMWFNTLSSGAFDAMSYHAGCPVIFGHKRGKNLLCLYFVSLTGRRRVLSNGVFCFLRSCLCFDELRWPKPSQVLHRSDETAGSFG